jgi:hypothetical protein
VAKAKVKAKAKTKPKAKAPGIGALINESLALSEQMNALKARNDELRKAILAELKATDTEIVETPRATAKLRRTTVAQIDDEPAFLEWALLDGNRDMLKVGVVGDAWRARRTSGVEVPGVTSFTREDLYLVKRVAA